MDNTNGTQNFAIRLTLDEMRRNAEEVRNTFRNIGNSAEAEGARIDQVFRNIGKTVAGIFTAQAAMNFARQVASVRGEFQQLEVAFKTMLGSADKANALMSQLVKTAATTPFDLQGVASGAKQLLAYGLASDKVNETLIRLGDIAAGLSIPLGDMVYLYGTTMTQGRLFTPDLRQFMGRGIPLADELVNQFGVAKDKVGELVTAGKVGFPEVQKAIEAMTNEGGKFAGLMEARSKTISGQISNLGDAIATMFNEIGKQSEGIISGAISGASYLVENYEKVGKAIAVLIATYGAYKAAVIAVAAAHKASVIWGNVSAFLSLAKSVRSAKDAMLLFNMAFKANPLGLVISAITAAISAFILFKTKTDEAAQAQAEMKKNIDDEIRKLDEVYNSVNKAKEGTEERKKAIDRFNSDYGQYLSKLLSEKSAVEDISNAYAEAKKSLVEFQIAKSKDDFLKGPVEDLAKATKDFYAELGDWTKELETPEQQARFTAYVDQILDDVKKGGNFNIDKIYDAFRAAQAKNSYANVDAWKEAFRAGNEAFGESDLDIIDRVGGWDVNGVDLLGKSIQRLQGVLINAESEFKEFSSIYTDIVSPETADAGDSKIQTFSEQVKAARENVSKITKELNDLKNNHIVPEGAAAGFDFSEAITAKEKELADAQEKLNTLTGYDPKAAKEATKEADARLKAQEKLDEELLSLERQNQQDDINLKEEGLQKKLDQIDLDYTKQEDAIRRRVKELAEANKEAGKTDVNADGLTTDQQKAIDDANRLNADARKKAEKDALKSLLDNYQSYTDQRLAIERKYNEDILALQDARRKAEEQGNTELVAQIDRSIATANSDKGKALAEHDYEMMKRSPDYVRAFEDLSKASSDMLKTLIKKFEDAKNEAAEVLDPQELKAYTDTLQRMYDELDSRNPFKAMTEAMKELADTQKEVNKAQDIFDKVKDGVEVINEATGEAYTQAEASELLANAKDNERNAYNRLLKSTASCAQSINSFAGTLTQLGESIGGRLGESISAVGGILGSLGGVFDSFKNYDVNATGIQKTMGQVSLVAGVANSMLKMNMQLSKLLPSADALYERYAAAQRKINDMHMAMIELELAQLQERLDAESWFYDNGLTEIKKMGEMTKGYLEAYQEVAAMPQEIYKDKKSGIAKWGAAIVGAIVGIVAGVFTFGAGSALGVAVGAALGSLGTALSATTVAALGATIFAGVGGALGQAVQSGIDKITYDKGQTAAVNNLRYRTRNRTFFRKEKTQDLESWVRENWGQELFTEVKGVRLVDPEVAKKLLEEQGNKLAGETKDTLQSLLEYSEKIHEFVDQVRDYVSEAFSPLVDDLADALWDWLEEGKDVMESFRKYAADTFKNIANDAVKAMANKLIFQPMQDQLEDLVTAYSMDTINEEQYMAALGEIARQTQDNIEKHLPALQHMMEVLNLSMESAGLDITGGEDGRTATAKGIAQASQDSVDELNGRFTAIQGHTFQINENVTKMAELQQVHLPLLQNLSYLAPIEENTYYCRRLDGMDADLHAMRQTMDNIELHIRKNL